MKRKGKTRLLSALLAVVFVVGLLPAAAASYDYYGNMDSRGYCHLSETGLLSAIPTLYPECEWFRIERANGAPYVRSSFHTDASNIALSKNELDTVYFDAGIYNYSYDYIYGYNYGYGYSYYDYTIYGYATEEDAGNGVNQSVPHTVRIYLNDSYYNSTSYSDGYIYAETDAYGELDMADVYNDLYYYYPDNLSYSYSYNRWTNTPCYVQFTSWTNGTLYSSYSSGRYNTASAADLFYFSSASYGTSYLGDAWFQTSDPYSESYLYFRVYDTYGYYVSGTLVVNSGASAAGDVTYSAAYNSSVSFSGGDFEDLLSSSQSLSYVTFSLPSSSKGALYWGNSALSSSDKLDSGDLDNVSFSPKSGVTGKVTFSFRLYYTTAGSSSLRSKTGSVVVNIDDVPAISYSGSAGSPVAFASGDFDDICYDKTKRGLSYVRFSLPASGKGTLYTASGGAAAKSTDKFYVDPGKGDYCLDDVVFVPKTSGAIEFSYTAYSASSSVSSYSGMVKITVAAGSLADIHYTVGTGGVTFSASDFTSALKSKSGGSLSSVTFTPPQSSAGVLYYNGSTQVTASSRYTADTVGKISFVPAASATGDVTVSYTATDSGGGAWSGRVVITTFVSQDTVLSYESDGGAVKFNVSDFTNACLLKINSDLFRVQFVLPSASEGVLYCRYGTAQEELVAADEHYLTDTRLPEITFVPAASFSGICTITYKGYDMDNHSYTGSIQVTVTQRTQSAYFADANEVWIASTADFLYEAGVYDNVVSGSALGVREQASRGEVMQMIYNAFDLSQNLTDTTAAAAGFSDVPPTHPNYVAILVARTMGVAQGGTENDFRPEEPITRQDAMTLLHRAFNVLGLNLIPGTASDLYAFGDWNQVDGYAVNALASMAKSGIIEGNEYGNINPKGLVTRGEISVMLYRALTL